MQWSMAGVILSKCWRLSYWFERGVSLLLGRSRSGASVGGSAGTGSFRISLPCFVIRRQLAGSWWALLSPFRRQPSHTNPQPLLSHPPGQRSTRPLWMFNFAPCCQMESTQQCPQPWNLPDPSLVLALPSLWTIPTGRPLDPSNPSLRSPLCDIPVTPMWLLAPGAL